MPQSKEVEDFLRSIGPFYEEVDEEPTQPSTDAVKNEPTGPQEQDTTNNPGTVEAIIDGTKEKKEVGSSDSEEEIFSDPIATPESPSVSMVVTSLHLFFCTSGKNCFYLQKKDNVLLL